MKYSRLLFVGGGMLASVFAAFSAKKSDKPNIVFILCDDMGYGDLGCYGQKYIETPNIDRMASEGMRFTQAYSGSPVSAPSRACIMTGQHTGHGEVRGNKEYWRDSGEVRYGVNTDYAIVGQHPYDPNRVILPEIMKENGYTTGMFGKWAGGYEGSVSTPDKRGIDEFFGYICQFQAHLYYPNFLNRYSSRLGDTATIRVTLEENIKYPMWGVGYALRPQYSADLIHEAAIDWLDRQSGDKPFFGFFTYTLPHAELVQPEDSLLNYYRERLGETRVFNGSYGGRYNPVTHTHAQFAAMIARLDNYVGEILKKLKEKGIVNIKVKDPAGYIVKQRYNVKKPKEPSCCYKSIEEIPYSDAALKESGFESCTRASLKNLLEIIWPVNFLCLLLQSKTVDFADVAQLARAADL